MSYSCNHMECSPPGFSVHGILQARMLEWVFPSPGDLPDPGIILHFFCLLISRHVLLHLNTSIPYVQGLGEAAVRLHLIEMVQVWKLTVKAKRARKGGGAPGPAACLDFGLEDWPNSWGWSESHCNLMMFQHFSLSSLEVPGHIGALYTYTLMKSCRDRSALAVGREGWVSHQGQWLPLKIPQIINHTDINVSAFPSHLCQPS